MSVQDMVFKITANTQSFTKEMRAVEKLTIEVSKKALAETKKQAEEQARLGREATKVFDDTRTAAEKYQKRLEELNKHKEAGRITEDTLARATKQAADEYKAAAKDLSGLGQITDHYKGKITALVSPVGLATAAVGLLVNGLKASHAAFWADKKASEELAMSLKSLGVEGAHLQDVFKGNASQYGYASKDQRDAYHTMIKVTGDAIQAEEDLVVAFDISAKKGIPLVEAANAIAQARRGNIEPLQDLTLLSVKEVDMLGQIDDKGRKASLALEAIEKHTKGAASETEKLNKRLNENTESFDEMMRAIGEASSELMGLVGGQGFFSRHLDNAMRDIRENMGYITLGAKWLNSGKSMDAFVEEMVQVEQAAKKASLAVGQMSMGQMSMDLDYSPDGYTNDERKIATEKLKQDLQGLKKITSAEAELKRLRAVAIAERKAEELKASEFRQKQLDYELKILKETDELEREWIRLEKEEAAIKATIKNEDEQKLALTLALEKSLQTQLEIQKKQKALEGPSAKQFALQAQVLAGLQTPLDKYSASLEDLNGLYVRGLLTQEQYEQATLNLNEELLKAEPTLQAATNSMEGLAQVGGAAAQSLMGSFKTALFDPMNFSFEDMTKNFVKAIGEMALQVLMLQAMKAAAEAIGGPAGGLIASIAGMSTGGPVRGPGTGTSDSILARLSDGEYVQRAAAVNHYGQAFMDDLNNLRIPKHRRYRDGGIVTAAGNKPTGGSYGGQQSAPGVDVTIVNAQNEQHVLDILASRAGSKIVMNTFLQNKQTIKL